jgi:hypothetical protein
VNSATFYLVIFGIPAAVVLFCVVTTSQARSRREMLLDGTGRHTYGRVADLGHSSDDLGSDTYWVKVEFDYDGELVTATVVLSKRDQQRYRVFQQVGLTFAPSKPKIVRLDPPDWRVPRVA